MNPSRATSSDRSEDSNRKFQVFISSTFRDLVRERGLALDEIIDRGHIPIALERYPASDTSVPEVIETAISRSQIYVVILGHRYGELVDGVKSFSEFEYDLAEKHKLVVLPFMLIPSEIERKRRELRDRLRELKDALGNLISGSLAHREIDKQATELQREVDSEQKLSDFHVRVGRNRYARPFSTDDPKFSKNVLAALEGAEKEAARRRVLGWVKEPADTDLAVTIRTVSMNPFLSDTIREMSQFERLDPRVTDRVEEKKALASFFSGTYLTYLNQKKVNLFFESGSTVAYVAKEIGAHMTIDSASGPPDRIVSTNNVLAYLYLWLIHKVPCSLFPWGPPEEHYGAVFGCLRDLFKQEPKPQFPPQRLGRAEREGIRKLNVDQYSPLGWKGPSLMLAALSGLQLDEQWRTDPPDEPVAGCLGPHVGSYRNKLFKRFMYEMRLPLMAFMTADKINRVVEIKKCHFVLDSDLSWDQFRRELPVAFCVGCPRESLSKHVAQFQGLGFDVIGNNDRDAHTAFIARNEPFKAQFEKAIGFAD